MSNLINHYDKRALMQFSEELKSPNTFLAGLFFRDINEFAVPTVDLDIYKGKRRTGAYVLRKQEGQSVDKIGYETLVLAPPYLKPKIHITASDVQKRMPGTPINDNSASLNSAVQDFVARQINDLNDIITRNEELQAKQALFDGAVTALNEDGGTLYTVSYGRDANLTYSPSVEWDESNADILADLREARRRVTRYSGYAANVVIMGREAADEFLANTNVQQQISKDWTGSRGELSYRMEASGGIYLGYADGFEFWTYEEWIINPANGTEELLIPSKKVLVAATNARATRVYAGVEVSDESGNLSVVANARYVDMYGQRDPAATIVQIHSAPLLVTNHPDAYAVLTVLT